MAEKETKRKRQSQGDKERPSKRQSLAPTNATLKVSYEDSRDQLHPVLGMWFGFVDYSSSLTAIQRLLLA